MHHVLTGDNLGLVVGRAGQAVGAGTWDVALISDDILDLNLFRRGGGNLFPLYLYPDPSTATLFEHEDVVSMGANRRANLRPAFVKDLCATLNLHFTEDGHDKIDRNVAPEDILHFVYAVLHSPSYRDRYADFLKIDFPRLPLTSNLELFRTLCTLGSDLVALHLLADEYAAASWNRDRRAQASPLRQPITTFVERGSGRTMGAFSKGTCYEDGRVYLDTSQRSRSSYFEGVPEEVWNFHIGGYQVCYKWLYDRRGTRGQPGRTLTEEDIAHYQRIVVALKETIRLMGEIDEVIEEHGGWPLS
jgi:predicted helicase